MDTSSVPHTGSLAGRGLYAPGLGGGGLRTGHWWWTVKRVLLAALAAVLLGALVAPLLAHHDRSFSTLQHGYTGPPVVATISGTRTQAGGGVCLVTVRDASSSVAGDIDPSGQINRESATVLQVLAHTGMTGDEVGAVTFDDAADFVTAGDPDDPEVAALLLRARTSGGTSILAGMHAARQSLQSCEPDAVRHIVLITDGVAPPDDITAGMATVPAGVRLHLVVLNADGDWSSRASLFRHADTTVTRIDHVGAGTVAKALAAVIEDATGQHVEVGFQS